MNQASALVFRTEKVHIIMVFDTFLHLRIIDIVVLRLFFEQLEVTAFLYKRLIYTIL